MLIPVSVGSQVYLIVLERGALQNVGKHLDLQRRVLIVTDDGVPAQYAAQVAAQCKSALRVTLPQGEKSKGMAEFSHLLSAMLTAGMTRGDCVVAVGGGVVGDLSGFAASCYMRGIDFYNIPTTLLAQVDSSIGGKTAIDFGGVKNSVGSFYSPKCVLIDPDVLQTLPKRQLAAGYAEIVKMAVTLDAELFTDLEQAESPLDISPDIIARALQNKRAIVQMDPTEHGVRRVLNFGHTIGHAIESVSDGHLLHGECVALGMLPMCAPPVRERLRKLLARAGLPTVITQDAQALLPYLQRDKKMDNTSLITVYVDEIGHSDFVRRRPTEILRLVEEAR